MLLRYLLTIPNTVPAENRFATTDAKSTFRIYYRDKYYSVSSYGIAADLVINSDRYKT